jgi:hypothetical protein
VGENFYTNILYGDVANPDDDSLSDKKIIEKDSRKNFVFTWILLRNRENIYE